MHTWIAQGQLALINGVLVFLVTLIPTLLWQYRRYGTVSGLRFLGATALGVYVAGLLTYTWLPLPVRSEQWCASHQVLPQLSPFRFVPDIAAAYAQRGFPAFLWSFTTLQVVLNVVLFVPWGVIVRRFLHRGIVAATASGLAASLVIETAQLTGLFGFYQCAYRTFDVDDLILNTSGALIGALIAPALLWWMPRARLLTRGRHLPRPITSWRRWIGMAIDTVSFTALSLGLTTIVMIAQLALGANINDATDLDWSGFLIGVVLPWVVCFVIPPWGGLAASAGQYAVWLTPKWRGPDGALTDGRLWQRLLRANVVAGPYLIAAALQQAIGVRWWTDLLWMAPAALAVAMVPFTSTKRSLGGVVTRCDMVDIRAD